MVLWPESDSQSLGMDAMSWGTALHKHFQSRHPVEKVLAASRPAVIAAESGESGRANCGQRLISVYQSSNLKASGILGPTMVQRF